MSLLTVDDCAQEYRSGNPFYERYNFYRPGESSAQQWRMNRHHCKLADVTDVTDVTM